MENYQVPFYRHLGVYGVCVKDNCILVIQKILGPYAGKYDLPGGRLDPGESLEQAITRELKEETGYSVQALHHIGVCDFSITWILEDNTEERLHHIAILYGISVDSRSPVALVRLFDDQDSGGALWLPFNEVNINNSSPLVLQAIEYINTQTLPLSIIAYDYRK